MSVEKPVLPAGLHKPPTEDILVQVPVHLLVCGRAKRGQQLLAVNASAQPGDLLVRYRNFGARLQRTSTSTEECNGADER